VKCGVDIGARSVEVLLHDGSDIVDMEIGDSLRDPRGNAERIFARVLERNGLSPEDLTSVIATGYGRNYFSPATRTYSEIICHARGVSHLFPGAATVIDIGGQDSKVIRLENGVPVDFTMNDRCAAGTGRFIEMAGEILGIPLQKMDQATAGDDSEVEISTMCAVFAESEIIGLLQGGTPRKNILRGVFRSVAARTLGMAGGAGIKPPLVFTGGVAANKGVVRAIQRETGLEVTVPHEPRITGALGAALI
jgi:(R)-2-hydroxyacyl-CoA dehydratese activating ATPase